MVAYLSMAIFSIVYCFYRLRSTGLSTEVKSLIYRRHIYWIITFVIANIYLMVLNFSVVLASFNPQKDKDFIVSFEENWVLILFSTFTNA